MKKNIAIGVMIIGTLVILISAYKIIQDKITINQNIKQWELKKQKFNEDYINGDCKDTDDSRNIFKDMESTDKDKEKDGDLKHYLDKYLSGEIIMKNNGCKIPLFDGVTSEILSAGAGRYTKSNKPGEFGNCVILGHRDGVFNILKKTHIGDEISVETLDCKFTYKVQNIEILNAEENERILKSEEYKDEKLLTLVTCYPFTYIGSAPQRYVVRAVKL